MRFLLTSSVLAFSGARGVSGSALCRVAAILERQQVVAAGEVAPAHAHDPPAAALVCGAAMLRRL